MVIYTSLAPSPGAVDTQLRCVQSWLDHGHAVTCVQGHADDIAASLPEGVNVRRVKPTISGHTPKPYVSLDSILDTFLESGDPHCCIINGDIEIRDPDGLIEASAGDALVCGRRWDHNGDKDGSVLFPSGFDFFVLNRDHAMSVPRSMFVIGQTWWDYWLPWSCLQAGHRLTTIGSAVAFHKRHPINYGHNDWVRMTHHFLWLTRRPMTTVPKRASGEIHSAINRAIQAP
jgi:hypothetical protein